MLPLFAASNGFLSIHLKCTASTKWYSVCRQIMTYIQLCTLSGRQMLNWGRSCCSSCAGRKRIAHNVNSLLFFLTGLLFEPDPPLGLSVKHHGFSLFLMFSCFREKLIRWNVLAFSWNPWFQILNRNALNPHNHVSITTFSWDWRI